MKKCECDILGRLQPGMKTSYDKTKELPFVKHKPNECKGTNELKKYIRNGKQIWLCSCCNLNSDMEE